MLLYTFIQLIEGNKMKYIVSLSVLLVLFTGCSKTWEGVKKDSSSAWKSTKKTSSNAWEATKEGTSKAYQSTKEAIHEATANKEEEK